MRKIEKAVESTTQETEVLRQGDVVRRAEAYGIDVSLLKLALTWTPTERVQEALELAEVVRILHRAGAKKHGSRAYSQATDER